MLNFKKLFISYPKTFVMTYLERMEYWGDHHHPKYLDILRIATGVFLILKGVDFASNTSSLINIVSGQVPFTEFVNVMLVHFIIFAHIFGGFLIAMGLLTRVASLVQIPILLGAMIFVNWQMLDYFAGFWLALLTLAAVIVFAIVGSGPWSVDRAIEEKRLQ